MTITIAEFLTLVQILNGLGGAGVAFLTIKKDIEARLAAGTHKPQDPLPQEHLPAVRTGLWPVLAQNPLGDPDAGE